MSDKKTMPNIWEKIAEVKRQFHKLKLEKTGHNKFAGYKYFELADFLIPALELLHDHGLCEVTSYTAETASMVIIDVDKPEDRVTITSPFSSANLKACHPVQNVGACETYQRRYLWVTFLQIVEHDAIDSAPAVDEAAEKIKTYTRQLNTAPDLDELHIIGAGLKQESENVQNTLRPIYVARQKALKQQAAE